MEPNQPYGTDPSRPTHEGGYYAPAGYPSGPHFGPPPGYGHQYGPPPFGPPFGAPGFEGGPSPDYQGPYQGAPGPATPRARTGLVVLVTLAVEVVLIAAFVNQGLATAISKFASRTHNHFLANVAGSALTYNWRFAPRSGDHQHVWLGQMMLIVTVLLFSGLLVAAVTRGPVTFGRAFFGTWMAVIVATEIGAFVRGLVTDGFFGQQQSGRVTNALFGPLGPGAYPFAAGLGLGLVTALITALVATFTRRTPAAPGAPGAPVPMPVPDQRPDQPAPDSGSAAWQDRNYGPPPRHGGPAPAEAPREDSALTTQIPVAGREAADTGATTRLPDADEPPSFGGTPTFPRHRSEPAASASGGGAEPGADPPSDATTQFPRVTEPGQPASAAAPQSAAPSPAGPLPAAEPPAAGPPPPTGPQAAAPPASGPPASGPPASGPPASGPPASGPQSAEQPTTQFPRPPDDEDLVPDHE